MSSKPITQEKITDFILFIRGHRVMLDRDLAVLYGVKTQALNQAVTRNKKRFPADFMFCLKKEEINLISQNVISSWGGSRKASRVFTEHGILMLSSVLRSERAIEVNIAIMRAFVRLRQVLSTNKELALKLELLEKKSEKHDKEIQAIFAAIRQLMSVPEQPKRKIGFQPGSENIQSSKGYHKL